MFACLECGRKFRTVKAAERAAFGDAGCPGCGGSDIDDVLALEVMTRSGFRPVDPDDEIDESDNPSNGWRNPLERLEESRVEAERRKEMMAEDDHANVAEEAGFWTFGKRGG